MNIKVHKRQRETFMVHGVSDQAIMSSPEGPNKADHGDSVTACMSKKSCVKEGPFTSQITENRNRNTTTPNLRGFRTPVR